MPTKGQMGKAPANDIFAAYRYDMQARGIKPHSIVTYDRVVGLFGEFLEATSMAVDDVRRPDVQRFLLETGWAPSTQRTALAYLRAAYSYAVEELELFERNPCRRVRLAKIIKEIPRTIPNQRLREMRDACRDDGDWLTLAMFMYTGMRTIEVRRLSWNDVSLSEGTMRVFGKGDKWRVVPIHQRLRRILIGRVFDRASGHVVPGRHGGMVSAGGLHYRLKRIAYEDVRNHDFRRTVATSLRQNRCDPYVRDAIMGWTRDEMFAQAYNAVSPRELHEGMALLYADDPV